MIINSSLDWKDCLLHLRRQSLLVSGSGINEMYSRVKSFHDWATEVSAMVGVLSSLEVTARQRGRLGKCRLCAAKLAEINLAIELKENEFVYMALGGS